ncbi:acyl-CoA dehydrogenase family protein [Micromonospora sp. WMMD882]|uniref:acyl-CoA dehydrogenase family protein n=1 Tax=Micromonospora sp. WMMD882 TaxID=3015151 RepID=UPI00248C8388|nr:acyl-CoA dehydrogenase family protein [Micromonospora sp. WMMD882]WBB80357.1 acyl-CoA dehydrogenase family protein [Micromonospora sp. WMMD882]
MTDAVAAAEAMVTDLVGDRAQEWDRSGRLPRDLLTKLGAGGYLCPRAPAGHGGLGWDSAQDGRFTAHVGSLCSSLRSVLTSQGMAAWTIDRLGADDQRADLLARLTGGDLAAVAFSEPGAGSDLSAITTRLVRDGDTVVVTGVKTWSTAAAYADLVVVFGVLDDDGGAGAVVVPTAAPGVRVDRIADPLGCRAAGHADVRLDAVRVPSAYLLGGGGQFLPLLVTTALAYGRMSVAWGCVGILRACLAAAGAHARTREQFGRAIGGHQLVARHLAELLVAERNATHACEHASRCWDQGSPDQVLATVLAKHVSATEAARGAAVAVQVLASAGARDGTAVARALRDAKCMEIIEGSNEMCQLLLADHVLAGAGAGERT